MIRSITLLFVVAITLIASAQTKFTQSPRKVPPPPAAAHDPHVRELISNSQVRVSRIDLNAGESTGSLQHNHDMLIVSIGDNDFVITGPVNSMPMNMRDSEVQIITGHWPHRIQNKAQHPLRLVEIEVTNGVEPQRARCGLNASSCRESRFAYNESDAYTSGTLFETPTVKLAKVEIDPQHGMPEHGHSGNHVMIALTDASLVSSVVGGSSTDFNAHPGDAAWLGGRMVHSLLNRGQQKAVFLTIDCK